MLRNEVLYYDSISERVLAQGIFKYKFKIFFKIEFFAFKALPQNFTKNGTRRKKKVIQYLSLLQQSVLSKWKSFPRPHLMNDVILYM
jgi:hypothetical protein